MHVVGVLVPYSQEGHLRSLESAKVKTQKNVGRGDTGGERRKTESEQTKATTACACARETCARA